MPHDSAAFVALRRRQHYRAVARRTSSKGRQQGLSVEAVTIGITWMIGAALIASPAFGQAVSSPDDPISINEDPTESFSLKYTQAGDLVRWEDKRFALALAPNTKLSNARVRRDLVNAMAEWETTGVAPGIDLEAGDSTVRNAERDGVNAIFFVEDGWEFDPNIVALTFTHIRNRDGVIVEMDMAVNAEFFNFGSDDDDEIVHDLQSVFTHEIGHAFGLPDFPQAPDATMYSVLDAGTTHPRELDVVDHDAIATLYEEGFEDPAAEPDGNCPNAPPTTFAFLLFGLGFRRRLKRIRHLAGGGLVAFGFAILLAAPADAKKSGARLVTADDVGGESHRHVDDADGPMGWVVSREAPRTVHGNLPATDIVIRGRDGTLLRVRVPGKATGEIQPRVLHRPIPSRGDEIVVPQFARVLDRSRSR